MDNRQRHEMILDASHPSGAQYWSCPTCGQSLLVMWIPRLMMVVCKAGNKSALHTLGNPPQSGSGQLVLPEDHVWEEEPETAPDEARLVPWIAWMEAVGFEKLWNKNVD